MRHATREDPGRCASGGRTWEKTSALLMLLLGAALAHAPLRGAHNRVSDAVPGRKQQVLRLLELTGKCCFRYRPSPDGAFQPAFVFWLG